jgi:hypothetical protein
VQGRAEPKLGAGVPAPVRRHNAPTDVRNVGPGGPRSSTLCWLHGLGPGAWEWDPGFPSALPSHHSIAIARSVIRDWGPQLEDDERPSDNPAAQFPASSHDIAHPATYPVRPGSRVAYFG